MNNAPSRLTPADARLQSAGQTSLPEHKGRGALALAIASALGLLGLGAAQAGNSSIIAGDGAHDLGTTVLNSGNVYDVTAGAAGRRGNGNAFNSFNEFQLRQGDTVNLHLDGARNLINLVWDSQALIDGTLNSLLPDGSIGGRVFFVDPHGVVVGANGQLNVGSLAMATPTSQFMDNLWDDLDGSSGGALDSLLTGTLRQDQLSAAGVAILPGAKINALNDVRIQARAIDVSGTIFVEAPVAGRNADFNLDTVIAVNTGGASTPQLVNDGGSIRLLAVDSVTLAAGGTARADGDIQLSAVSRAAAQSGFAEASALVTVDGTIVGRNIDLQATAIADSSWTDPAADASSLLSNISDIDALADTALDLGLAQLDGQIAFLHTDTTAKVTVGNAATLAATGDVNLHAQTAQVINASAAGKQYESEEDPQTGEKRKHLLSVGAVYAEVNATTEVIVKGRAAISAGGSLSAKADADVRLKVAAESHAVNNTMAGFTAAISNVNVNTHASLAAGTGAIAAGAVDVSAVNTASLETAAAAHADAQGAVGLAGAVSLQDIHASAALDRSISGLTGDAVVQAASITALNATHTLIDGPKKDDDEEATASGADGEGLMDLLQGLAGKGMALAGGVLSGDSGPSNDPPPSPFRLGGAISFTNGDHTAAASVGNGVRLITTGGDVVVHSEVVDAQIGHHAISNVEAKGDDGAGAKFGLSAAVNVSLLDHEAGTLVGSGAELSGRRIGLGSDVRLPRDFSKLQAALPDFSSFEAFKDSITAAKTLIGDPSDLFTTYGAAKGSADSVAIGGVVSYFSADNTARTDVASGARLTATDTQGGAWNAALDGVDQAGDARSVDFDASVAVQAAIDVTSIHAAGDLGLTLERVSVGDGGVAVGGSVGYIDYDNRVQAIVNDGVRIDSASDVAIDAYNQETIVSLALQSGSGGSIGVNGTASALDLKSVTQAGLSNGANVTTGSLVVDASEDLFAWSVAGAVTMSDSISVGASVAYQQMETDTRAFVGEVPDALRTGAAVAGSGGIHADSVGVRAASHGTAGAVAAAGAVAKSKSQQQKDLETEKNAQNPGFVSKLKTRADSKVTALQDKANGGSAAGGGVLDEYFGKAHEALGAGGSDDQKMVQPKFGVAVSGSATVNRIRQNTNASIDGATIVARAPARGVAVDASALNDTLLVSISGALAATIANSDNNQGSAAIAGAVAYGDVKNDTSALLENSTVVDAASVSLKADNATEQVNIGLGIGINASSDQSTAASVAASVTLGMSRNQTGAMIGNTDISGRASGADIGVTAANASRIANGGGAMYAGGKVGIGAAVTYASIQDTATAAISGVGTAGAGISRAGDVTVQALDASRIVAAAAMGGVTTEQGSFGGGASVVVNEVSNTTAAVVNNGAKIAFGGNLEVFAGTATLADPASNCSSAAGVDYCGNAATAVEADANSDVAGGTDANGTQVAAANRNQSASSIMAVAGTLQVATNGNAAGLSFAYNTVDNEHTVTVNDATLTSTAAAGSTGTGRVQLHARDATDILSIAAGIGAGGGQFAGVGSATYNAIGNTTAVLVGKSVDELKAELAGGAAGSGARNTRIDANRLSLEASDDSYIASLSGAATYGGKAAVGAALTINRIGNTTAAYVGDSEVAVGGALDVVADNTAKILSGAIALGAAGEVAVQGSLVWADIGNTALARVGNSQLQAGSLSLDAGNASKAYTLAGAVAGGSTAAIGAAINIAMITDHTEAALEDVDVKIDGKVAVAAGSTGATKNLAVAGAVASTAAVAGSAATNRIDSNTRATARQLRGLDGVGDAAVGALEISAANSASIHALAGAVGGASSAAVGAAVTVNQIGGETSAKLSDTLLLTEGDVTVMADATARIQSLAAAGAVAAGGVGAAGSNATNIIGSHTLALLENTALHGRAPDITAGLTRASDVTVSAHDQRRIDSLAGAVGGGSAGGAGLAVAYNEISGSTEAGLLGGNGRQVHARNVLVTAGSDGEINTVAAGVGAGGNVGAGGSAAINVMEGATKALIGDGADVIAEHNVGVLAAQRQQVNVLAGALGVGGSTAGVGLGTVVNMMVGSTYAGITGADTRVSALAADTGDTLWVDSGVRSHGGNVGSSGLEGRADYTGVDLGTGQVAINGLAVNAATAQEVATVGVSGAFTFNPLGSAAISAMVGVSQVGTGTTAEILGAEINRHDLSGWVPGYIAPPPGTPGGGSDDKPDNGQPGMDAVWFAGDRQQVDVRASSHVSAASFIAGVAGGGSFSGAGAGITTVFTTETLARMLDADVGAAAGVAVQALASQQSIQIGTGLAGGLVGGAGTVLVNMFDSSTGAVVSGGTLNAGRLDVTADNDSAALLVAGAIAGGGVAVSGTTLVNLVGTTTHAAIGEAGHATSVVTSGGVSVRANSHGDYTGVAVSGSGAGGVAVAGMAQFHQINGTTRAELVNADVSGKTVEVQAADHLQIDANAGVVAGGGSAGVGAAANIVMLGSEVVARVVDSQVSATSLDVSALSDRAVDMVTMTAGAGGSAGIGAATGVLLTGRGGIGAAAGEVASEDPAAQGNTYDNLGDTASGSMVSGADPNLLDTIGSSRLAQLQGRSRGQVGSLDGSTDLTQARISGGRISVQGLTLDAVSRMTSNNLVGGLGVGGIGFGGGVGYSALRGRTSARIDDAQVEAGNILVTAQAGDGSGAAATVDAFAGGAGLVGLGAAVALIEVAQQVDAAASGVLTGNGSGTFAMSASDRSTLDANVIGAAVGAAAVGVVVAEAQRSSAVNSLLGSGGTTHLAGFRHASVVAELAGRIDADAVGASAGFAGAGSAVVVMASEDAEVTAAIGSDTRIELVASPVADGEPARAPRLDVVARADTDVNARGTGASVSAGVALGAVVVDARSNVDVRATAGDRVWIGDGDTRIAAERGVKGGGVSAAAIAGSGGLYLAGSAAMATAHSGGAVEASTGDGVALGSGSTQVVATHFTEQQADATGIAVGMLAAGAVFSDATSDTATRALLGSRNTAGLMTGAAYALAGDIVVAANGRDSNLAASVAGSGGLVAGNAAIARTDAKADVLASVGDETTLVAGSIAVNAAHDTYYGGQSDSTNASLLGASGAAAHNRANATVKARVGANAELMSGKSIDVVAQNRFFADEADSRVSAAAGGVVNGSAALMDTRLDGDTRAEIGNNANLRSGMQSMDSASINVLAKTVANVSDTVDLSTGGAIAVAVVDANLLANFSNLVSVGNNASLLSNGYLNLGTTVGGYLGSSGYVNTWGLAAVGTTDVNVVANLTESVRIGEQVQMGAIYNAYITAGRNGLGLEQTNLTTHAQADGYVRGLVAVPVVSANAYAKDNASVVVGNGSTLLGASDVYLGSYSEGLSRLSRGVGYGYQLGFIPVKVSSSKTGGAQESTSEVQLNGTLTAGAYNSLRLDIAANGTVSGDIGWTRVTAGDYIAATGQGLDESISDSDYVYWLENMYAAGGDVFLHGATIGGTGAAIAKGAPTISVNNASGDHLAFGNIFVPDYAGGQVRYTGASMDAGGIRVQSDAGTSSTISIRNTSTSPTSIVQNGDLYAIASDVTLSTLSGSLIQAGSVFARTYNPYAPNGTVTFRNRYADYVAGSSPEADWLSYMLGGISADAAAGYIANSVVGGATSTQDLNDKLLQRPNGSGQVTFRRADGSTYTRTFAGTSLVVYGYCLPFVGSANCSTQQNGYANYDYVRFPYNHGSNTQYAPSVSQRQLSSSHSYASNQQAAVNAAASTTKAKEINVVARYINIASSIEAGAGVSWALQIEDSLAAQNWFKARDLQGGLHAIPASMLKTIGADSSLISASYDATSQRIVVNNVNASGGGVVKLDGRIVSTSPYGKINVSAGYGSVRVDSDVDRAVQLGNVNVGTGGKGVVQIIDRNKTRTIDGQSTPYEITYTSNLDGSVGVTDNWATPGLSASSYNPLANQVYSWTRRANVKRSLDRDANTAGQWAFVNASGQPTSGAGTWVRTGGGFATVSAGDMVSGFEREISGDFTNYLNEYVGYGCGGATSSCNFGFPGTPEWDADDKRWETIWRYRMPGAGYLQVKGTVQADNPIGINFVTGSNGLIDVDVVGDLYLAGTLNNSGGSTSLTTTAGVVGGEGHIIQATERANITTHDLVMSAAGGIGTGALGAVKAFIQSNDSAAQGSLVASSTGGSINLDLSSSAALSISATNGGKAADVAIIANGDLTGITGNTIDVSGSNVALTSRYGSIGSTARLLVLDAHEAQTANNQLSGGVVRLDAFNDVSVRDVTGDLWLESVRARNGDVRLEAPGGSILDASGRTSAAGLTDAQIRQIRDRLKLDGSGVADTVVTYERQATARYGEYWSLLPWGNLAGGQFVATSAGIELFRAAATLAAGSGTPLGDAEVAAYVDRRYQSLVGHFSGLYGGDWAQGALFSSHDPGYAFTIDPASSLYASLAANARWTDDQLRYAINAGALEPEAPSIGTTDPTVVGRNITLIARDGVGQVADALEIAYADFLAGNLDDAQALALSLANSAGDAELIGPDGRVLSADELAALTVDQVLSGAIARIRIKQTSPLFLAAQGQLDATAGAGLFVQSTENLKVGTLRAGADLRLSVDGNLTGAVSNAPAIMAGGDAVLAANGNIGAVGSPFGIEVAGTLVSASAGEDLRLRQYGGDLSFGRLYAEGALAIDVVDGSLLADSDAVAISGHDVELTARDDIAAATTAGALGVQLSTVGRLRASAGRDVRLHAVGDLTADSVAAGRDIVLAVDGSLAAGTLDAGRLLRVDAVGNLAIDSAVALGRMSLASGGWMHLGTVQGDEDVELVAVGDLVLDHAQAADALVISAGGVATIADGGELAATAIALDAGALSMGAGSVLRSTDNMVLVTTGNMQLGEIQVSGVPGTTLDIAAGGLIAGNAGVPVHLHVGPDVAVSLLARGSIGTTATAMGITGGRIDAQSNTGSIDLAFAGDARIDRIDALHGDVTIAGDASIDVASVAVGGNARIEAVTDLTVDTAQIAGDANLQSGEALAIGTAGIDGDAVFTAGSSQAVGNVDVGGNAALNAGTSLSVGNANLGGDAALSAGTALLVGNATVGGDAALASGTTLQIDTLDVTGALTADAGTTLAATLLQSGNTMTLSSGDSLTVQQLVGGSDVIATGGSDLHLVDATSAGALTLTAGNTLQVDQSTVGGNATWLAGSDLTVGSTQIVGEATLQSGESMAVGTARIDGDAVFTAGSTLVVGNADVGGNAALNAGTSLSVGNANLGGDAALNAGAALLVGNAKVGGDAAINAGSTVQIGTLDVGGALAADAGTTLAATLLQSGGTMTLSTGDTLTVQQLAGGSDVIATAGSDLHLVDATSAGALTLTAGNTLQVDQSTVGGNATWLAGSDLTVGSTQIVGEATLQSGEALAVGTARIDGDAVFTAGSSQAVGNVDVGGNAALHAGTSLSVGNANLGGDAALNAGTALLVGNATVGGDAALASGTTLQIDTLDVGETLTADAGTKLAATLLQAGGTMTLSSGDTLTVQQLDGGRDVIATGGSDLHLVDATSAGALTLTAGSTLQVDQSTVGGNATWLAGSDLTVGSTQIVGEATLQSGEALAIGTAEVGGNALLTAGTLLTLGSAQVRGDASLQATENISGGILQVGSDAIVTSGGTTVFDAIGAGSSARVDAGRDVRVGEITALRGDVTVAAGNDIHAGAVTAGRDVDMAAANQLHVSSVQAGRNSRLQAGHALDVDTLTATGNIHLTSLSSDISTGDLRGGREVSLSAARHIKVGSAVSGTDLLAASGGDQQWGRYSAGDDVSVMAGGRIAIADGRARHDQRITAGGNLRFDTLEAGHAIWIDAAGGDAVGSAMVASSADVAARGGIVIDSASVADRLNLAATDIQVNVTQSDAASGPLTTTLTGYENGVARRIQLEVDARDAWVMDRLQTLQAVLDTNADQVDIEKGWVGQSMELTTPHAYLWMDNISQRLRSADVQLTQPGNAFQLQQTGLETYTDAYVVRFADGYRVAAPNHNPAHHWGQVEYLGESAIRYMQRMLRPVSARSDEAGDARNETGYGDVVVGANGSVNMGAPN